VPLRLDGLTLTGARTADRERPLRALAEGRWEVELRGRGTQRVLVSLVAPVRTTAEGKRIELPIPEAASTGFVIGVPQRVEGAETGPAEPVALRPNKETGLTDLEGEVTPRPRFVLVWNVEEEAGAALSPLLVAQGEIAIEIDSGSLRTRSSWAIRSLRGSTRTLQIRLDPDDEVRELELDGQEPPAGMEKSGGAMLMTIPLTEPLGPGQERRLVMTTRRSTPVGASSRVGFSGFPLIDASEQTGAIGISRGNQLWVSAAAGRGVRQIDPRTELPTELRSRPGTELAFQFSEQPFDLSLKVEPSLTLVSARSRSTVSLEAASARVETWLDYQTARGRLFELNLAVPSGIEVESVGPSDVVQSWQSGQSPEAFPPGGVPAGSRPLTVRVAARVQDGGRFSLQVIARQPIDPSKPISVGLIQPVGVISGGGRVAVVSEPSIGVELVGDGRTGAELIPFRPSLSGPPADWPWPSGRVPNTPPSLWLRYENGPAALPLKLTVHPIKLSHSTTLMVRLDRRGAAVQQEVECGIRFGTTNHVDVTVPEAVRDTWEVEAPAGVTRTELDGGERGASRVRLNLPVELNRSTRLRFRYRIDYGSALLNEASTSLSIPWIRLPESSGAVAPIRATIVGEPGVSPALGGKGWTPGESSLTDRDSSPDRLSCSAAEATGLGLDLRVSALPLAVLPTVVVPRLWVRTAQGADGRRLTTASFAVESTDPWFLLALPPGADLVRARVGGTPVRQVERLPQGAGVRINLGAGQTAAPTVVEIEYTTPASLSSSGWEAPRALGRSVVQQTYWEVILPPGHAVVGVPSGWTDENRWLWDIFAWKRRSLMTGDELAGWLWGGSVKPPEGGAEIGEGSRFLFGNPVGLTELPVVVASRALLVTLCSGTVLATGGLLLLVWRPTLRIVWAAAGGGGLAVAALVHPSVTLLVVQSGAVGVGLTAVIALMQRWVERRKHARAGYPELGTPGPGSALPGSSLNRDLAVGSDDSTAIRARPVSTVDYPRQQPVSPVSSPPAVDESETTATRPRSVGSGAAPQ